MAKNTQEEKLSGVIEGVVYGFATAFGFTVAIIILAGIREKIEDNPANPTYITTKRGVGYYFKGE